MAGQVDLEDSNMANYGSEEHRQMRQDAARGEPAWEGAGNNPGIEIWRIEKFQVVRWPQDRYGEFYSGDSYIILHTKLDDEGKKEYDAFFWLGAETTQDEMGTAAYKTVELDDLLGDEPVQYREVQGNETKRFLDLFDRMTILDGGIETGFTHVKPTEYQPRLMHITGHKKHVQVYQVPIRPESLNDTDCFVLDAGLKIFQFNGTRSSAWEKRKANAVVDELQAQRHGKVRETYIIDGIADSGNALIDEFWTYFGGRPGSIPDAEEMKEPPQVEMTIQHISDASGRMEVNEVCRGNLDRSVLNSDDAFIVDAGAALFVWIGNGANRAEKREAMRRAVEYLQQSGRDTNIPIARVMEGKEPPEFHAAFSGRAVGGRQTDANAWK
jgi:gelsolin